MLSSPSSASVKETKGTPGVGLRVATVTLRLAIGAVFIVSGFAKSVDLWGTVYKIEEYLGVWGIYVPATLIVTASALLSWSEFVAGGLLFLGCYRRVSVWFLTAMMAIMLPLTLYIWIEDPVSDCGCFGDMLVLSNGATFAKNVALTAGLVILMIYNRRVKGLFTAYSQWLVGAILTGFSILVGLRGFNVQPVLDFRPFPEGTTLSTTEDEDEDARYEFVYEKDGERRVFGEEELPEEGTGWTFVDRRLVGGSEEARDGLTVYEDGEEVTSQAIMREGEQILISVPDVSRINPGQTYFINEMNREMESRGGNLTVLLSPDEGGTEYWDDIAMADYPVYTADASRLKELVRGNPGVVFLKDGKIEWKTSLGSVMDPESFRQAIDTDELKGRGRRWIASIGVVFGIMLGVTWLLDRAGLTLNRLFRRYRKRKE